uniref:Uncharacterized protein n=1 Tax=Compsopogon caeruleus TaxID=31354 RepID=A0A7S1TI09_9RHOD|mmetsp:Transcript_8620/g.17466  ORF Transcript_8620/g.17466 Transcript_8620/m.17466 type:complete len:232 (+) Transcript_8620:88-783(+)
MPSPTYALVRARRALFYLVSVLVFSHVVLAQMRYQTPRPDRPIRVFGGRAVYLTVQVNTILMAYAALCLADCLLGQRSKVLSHASRNLSAIVFPLGVFMGSGYYGFIHFHPKTRLLAQEVDDFDFYMHLLHGVPLLFVLSDNLFDCIGLRYRLCENSIRMNMHALVVSMYGLLYVFWSIFCSIMNEGWSPYPVSRGTAFGPSPSPLKALPAFDPQYRNLSFCRQCPSLKDC